MTQTADTKPGNYYVSIKNNAGQYVLALGPFASHQPALDQVDAVTALACKLDPKAHWYAFGTCRLPLEEKATAGKLNGHMPNESQPCAAVLLRNEVHRENAELVAKGFAPYPTAHLYSGVAA